MIKLDKGIILQGWPHPSHGQKLAEARSVCGG